jgi:hypothetical protein
MRRAALLLLTCLAATALHATTVDPERAALHAQAIRAFYPRPEASAAEDLLLEYIMNAVRDTGLMPQQLDFAGYSEAHSFSRIVVVDIPPAEGAAERDGHLLVAAPINSRDLADPDEDGTPSVAALLALVESLAAEPVAQRITVLFLGAEYGPTAAYPLGSRRFLSGYFPEGPQALLYLDATATPLLLEAGGDGSVAPSWLIRATVDAARATGLEIATRPGMYQLNRLGVAPAHPALAAYLAAGIPAVLVDSDTPDLYAPDLDRASRSLAQFASSWLAEFGDGVPSEWDRHFLYFRLGTRQLVVGERVFVIAFIVLILASLLYALILRRRFSRYVRTVGRNLWNIPVLYLLIFGFLAAATYLLELFVLVRGFPTIWEYYPGAYVAFKLAMALFMFLVAAQIIRRLPLSKNGSFYSAATIFVLLIDIVIFSVLNLSVGFYFMWAFLFAFLFSIVRSRALKIIALLLAPLFLIRVAVEVIQVQALQVVEVLLLSTTGDLLLAFMLLPFLLMMIRLDFLIRHPVRGRRSFALRTSSIVAGIAVTGILVFVLVADPFDEETPQPVTAVETVDYPQLQRRLELTSPAPIGDAVVEFAGQEYSLADAGRSTTLVSQRLPDVLSARLSYSTFLDRERGELVITAPQPIDDLEIRFTSNEPMILYDANFPLRVAADELSARILVGRRPEMPLTVIFTLSALTSPTISITATSKTHPDPLEIVAEGIEPTTELRIRSRLGR